MPWNQPGNGKHQDQDPWQRDRDRFRDDGPPDLDELIRNARDRLERMLGGGGGGSGSGGRSANWPGGGLIGVAILIGVGFWLFSGFYIVDEGEQAVELRFGSYKETKGAGLHYHLPAPIETVEVLNTRSLKKVEVGYRDAGRNLQSVPSEALMLTQDENIIDIQFAVQYDIKDPTALLFNVSEYDPGVVDVAETVVRQATESAVREIVGRNTMDFAIAEGRAQLAAETKGLVQSILDRYGTGINIVAVEMQNAQPPAQVKGAFDDVVKAREDEQRLKNLAEAYANDIIPRARGAAARITQEAEAYRLAVIAEATGAASRFSQILGEYAKAPQITRDRLYLEAIESVLQQSNKLVIDQSAGNSLMYLPIDQLLRRSDDDERLRPSPNSAALPPATDFGGGDDSLGTGTRAGTRSSRSSP